jgi:hypothetical protein
VTTTVYTPRHRIEDACRAHGAAAVADACMRLIAGGELDDVMRDVFSEVHSQKWLDNEVNAYWLRVWGARGLMWNWDPRAIESIRAALADEAWRVRAAAMRALALLAAQD